MRPEDEHAQNRRRNRCNEDSAGRYVLCFLNTKMELRLDHIAEILEGRVEGFGDPDQRNGKYDPEPLCPVQPETISGNANGNSDQQMDLGVVLVAQHVTQARPRKTKAPQPGTNAEALRTQCEGRHSTPEDARTAALPAKRTASARIAAIKAQQGILHLSSRA